MRRIMLLRMSAWALGSSSSRLCPSCFALWRTNTTTLPQPSSHSLLTSSSRYVRPCSPFFPSFNATIQYKRAKKNNPDEPIFQERRAFLKQTLDTILEKMKWDEEDDPGDMDEDDLAAFDLLRKVRIFLLTSLRVIALTLYVHLQDLRVFLDSIQTLDHDLVTSTIHSLAITTLTAFEGGISLKWQAAELAIHLVYLYGEIIKGSDIFLLI